MTDRDEDYIHALPCVCDCGTEYPPSGDCPDCAQFDTDMAALRALAHLIEAQR